MEFSRQEQLNAATAALARHDDLGELLLAATRTYSAQSSHLKGLYDEVDKLTKGKSLVPTSDLLVDVVNSLISDAKALVYRDTYLDRLKTFVPAGDNPNYPDVLIALRILQQSLERFRSLLEVETGKHEPIGTELRTILSALRVAFRDELEFDESNDSVSADEEDGPNDPEGQDEEEAGAASEADDEDEEEDAEYEDDDDSEQVDEYEEYVTKPQVRAGLDTGGLSGRWFRKSGDEAIFNFAMLDRLGIPKYEPPSEGITFIKSDR